MSSTKFAPSFISIGSVDDHSFQENSAIEIACGVLSRNRQYYTASLQIPLFEKQDLDYRLYLLETFAERGRFKGTCYHAANWEQKGETKGHAKKNVAFYHHGNIKDVYLYPLRRDFRGKLCRDGGLS